MNELTFEEFCELRIGHRMGMTFDDSALRIYRNDEYGVQVETHTKKNTRTGKWGKGKRYFLLDGDDRCFEKSDQCYVAYMEKICGVKHD